MGLFSKRRSRRESRNSGVNNAAEPSMAEASNSEVQDELSESSVEEEESSVLSAAMASEDGLELPPPESLPHVEVTIDPEAWVELSPEEQTSFIEYVQAKEDFAIESKFSGTMFKVKLSNVVLEATTDEAFAALQGQADNNQDSMEAGPEEEVNGVIDMQQERTIPILELTNPEEYEAKTFDASSTFPSDMWRAEDLNEDEFNATLEKAAEQIQKLQSQFGAELPIRFILEASESQVPSRNYAEKELSELRAQTAEQQAYAWLSGAGIDLTNVSFEQDTKVGPTAWDPGAGDKAGDQKFTDEQYLRATVEIEGQEPPVVHGEPEPEVSAQEISTERLPEDDDEFDKTTFVTDVSASMYDNFDMIADWADEVELGDTKLGGMTHFTKDVDQHDGGNEMDWKDSKKTLNKLGRLNMDKTRNRKQKKRKKDRAKQLSDAFKNIGGGREESAITTALKLLNEIGDEDAASVKGQQIVIATDEGDSNPKEIRELQQQANEKGVLIKVLYWHKDNLYEINLNQLTEKTLQQLDAEFTADEDGQDEKGELTSRRRNDSKLTPGEDHLELNWKDLAEAEGIEPVEKIKNRESRKTP